MPKVQALKVGDPLDPDTQVGPVIDHENRDRIKSWVDAAVAGGATLLAGGEVGDDGLLRPTLLGNVSLDMDVACHEVFGPVVTVARVSGLDHAIEQANGTEYGLQAGIFTSDITQGDGGRARPRLRRRHHQRGAHLPCRPDALRRRQGVGQHP